jgi:pyrimidine operon attenuation protein/uracil phosphoribosyltransferase
MPDQDAIRLTLVRMAMEIDVQRLQLGDVILVDLPDRGTNIEATVVRDLEVLRERERSNSTVRTMLRVPGRDDFMMEWPLDAKVTIVRGP